MGVSNKQNVSTCLSFAVIAENRSKMGAILNFKMAATRGREYVGGIFFQLPLGGSTPVQSFMLASKTERSWWICDICRSTNGADRETDGRTPSGRQACMLYAVAR